MHVASTVQCEVIQTIGPLQMCLAYSIDCWKTATLLPPHNRYLEYGQKVDIMPGKTRRYRAILGQAVGPPEEIGGCFFCLKSFPRSRIDHYDETWNGNALCPMCGVEAVTFTTHTSETLKKLRSEIWR